MYVTHDYPTKKSLKEDVDRRNALIESKDEADIHIVQELSSRLTVYNPGVHNVPLTNQKMLSVEGPHFPTPHAWWAIVDTNSRGVIVRIK